VKRTLRKPQRAFHQAGARVYAVGTNRDVDSYELVANILNHNDSPEGTLRERNDTQTIALFEWLFLPSFLDKMTSIEVGN
jgi:hypothetical protein